MHGAHAGRTRKPGWAAQPRGSCPALGTIGRSSNGFLEIYSTYKHNRKHYIRVLGAATKMVQIDRLVLGTDFTNLMVEVYSLEGVDPESKPEDPAHIATVGDATGFITLVFRASTACRPTQVKKGKTYLVTGETCCNSICAYIGSACSKRACR